MLAERGIDVSYETIRRWMVLSDQVELVSTWRVTLPFIPRRVGATRPERRIGSA